MYRAGYTERGRGIKIGLFLHTTKFQFFCRMYSPICLLDRVIQDIVQKALFPEI